MHFGAESPFRLKRKNADANHCLPINLLVLASALAKLVAFNKIGSISFLPASNVKSKHIRESNEPNFWI